MALTPEEKAQIAIQTRKLVVQGLHNDEEYQATIRADAARKVDLARTLRHKSAMADFKSGNALDRAVEGFKVKRAVADLAKSHGLNPNGTAIKVAPVVIEESSDAESDSDSA